MNQFEFLDLTPTPAEKYKCVISVRLYGKVVLRYKIVAKKDGSGYFPTCNSYKIPGFSGSDEYQECFMLEMRSENEGLLKFIMSHFNQWHSSQNAKSIFSSNPVTDSNLNNSYIQPKEIQDGLPF